MRDKSSIASEIDKLFDLTIEATDGVTIEQIARHLGVSLDVARDRVRQIRLFLKGEKQNLVATPNGSRRRWLYKMTGDTAVARPWTENRTIDLEARIETITAVCQAIVNATDARTIPGRKARKILRTLTFLQEELADIA